MGHWVEEPRVSKRQVPRSLLAGRRNHLLLPENRMDASPGAGALQNDACFFSGPTLARVVGSRPTRRIGDERGCGGAHKPCQDQARAPGLAGLADLCLRDLRGRVWWGSSESAGGGGAGGGLRGWSGDQRRPRRQEYHELVLTISQDDALWSGKSLTTKLLANEFVMV